MTPPPERVLAERQALIQRRFPEGVPTLWCPLLSHFTAEGALDERRVLAHLEQVAAWVPGILVGGSTGDGWDLAEPELRQLLEAVLEHATRLRIHVLVGALRRDAAEARALALRLLELICLRAGEKTIDAALHRSRVVGFTVCPPTGADLSQETIGQDLAQVLDTGLPMALYQLPQVTANEMTPALVADLASRFPNFLLLKDTSGNDRIAQHRPPPPGVILVRGAEGDYVRWLRRSGGPYDGLLVSSANGFAREMHHMVRDLERRRAADAQALSDRVGAAVNEVFALAKGVPSGNAFANTNRAIDHFMAYGARGTQRPPPALHGGGRLPGALLQRTAEILRRHRLMPPTGYLE